MSEMEKIIVLLEKIIKNEYLHISRTMIKSIARPNVSAEVKC